MCNRQKVNTIRYNNCRYEWSLQRGVPALISKWYRTKMALANGVDLVVELPYVFATQKAETFANGAISILNALRVSEICFGSEDGQIENFIIPSPYKTKKRLLTAL